MDEKIEKKNSNFFFEKLDHFKIFSCHIFAVGGAQVEIVKYLRKRKIEKKNERP